MNKKRGQIAIFVIAGIVIVAIVVLFFVLRGGVQQARIGEGKQEDLEGFLQTCLEDEIREGVEIVSLQGGYVSNPLNISFKLEEEEQPVDISYLCYTEEEGTLCINQEPVLFRHLGDEIESYIKEDAETCFDSLVSSLESQGFSISQQDYNGLNVNLEPRKVVASIDAEITSTKSGETSNYENFEVEIGSRLNELAMVAQDIVNSEALSCDFNYPIYSLDKPEYKIRRHLTSDSSKVYRVQHRETGKDFRFVIKSCPTSPGWP